MLSRNAIASTLILAGLAGAHAADAPPADSAAPPPAPKLEFAKLRTTINPGDKIGHTQAGYFCFDGGDMHAASNFEAVTNELAALSFKRELKALNLNNATAEISAFDTGQPSDADYRIGGVLTAFDDDICSYPNGIKGSINVTVKWDIFSTRQQRVVMSKETQGGFRLSAFDKITGRDFLLHGMDAALDGLLTDPDVKGLFAGNVPALPPVTLAPLHLKGGRALPGGTQTNAGALKDAVVTILSDKGSGSGFYVADGYVLTNRHVVGNAKYVKIKLESGKELVGEVVREDGPRDVALLKTESAGMPILPLRLADPAVGEDVYAIGSPFSQKLSGTFTKGVLSGVRESDGIRFLQSDVAVNPGNSGGPLLDNAGNAVGMTTLKLPGSAGLAFFVPMQDAAARLAIVFDAP